jgi:hypothetical protein
MITTKKERYYLQTLRYNNNTYNEVQQYKREKNIVGSFYNVPREIKKSLMPLCKIFVFEMNNEKNQIMGIGYIINHNKYDKFHRVHSDNFYNLYSYKGKQHVNREHIISNRGYIPILETLEHIVFKGKNHIKRGQGFISIPEKKLKEYKDIKKKIFYMLKNLFDI